jgi:hypothetical protein
MFLTWISMALHHVAARWQTAIDAVDSQIDSPHAVIFHEDEDKSDLLSDDPNFSRSKTYFWAIQVFRLFEETLTKTIATWEEFKKDSLLKVNDGNIEHWEAQVQMIDNAIRSLNDKLRRVQKKREEVVSLRDGVCHTRVCRHCLLLTASSSYSVLRRSSTVAQPSGKETTSGSLRI